MIIHVVLGTKCEKGLDSNATLMLWKVWLGEKDKGKQNSINSNAIDNMLVIHRFMSMKHLGRSYKIVNWNKSSERNVNQEVSKFILKEFYVNLKGCSFKRF
jgi:hypothetical protein